MEFDWLRLFLEHRGFCTRGTGEPAGNKRDPLHGFARLEFFRGESRVEPAPAANPPSSFYLYSKDLERWNHGTVLVRPWHAWQSRPDRLKSSADFFRLVEKNLRKEPFPPETLSPLLLLLPGSPSSDPWKTRLREHLQSKGIQAVLSLRAIVHEMIQQSDPLLTQGNAGNNQALDLLRLLRFYDLLKDPQMELFS